MAQAWPGSPAEVRAAAARLGRDRLGAFAQLDELFRRGRVPEPALQGRYAGHSISLSVHPWLDAVGRGLFGLWLPWRGKTFNAAAQTGDNIFTNDGRWLARLTWPRFRAFVPDGLGSSRALPFRTYVGPGKLDPGVNVLKIDYDWDVSPAFILRRVLDELVQIEPGYYLGKALLRRRTGAYFCCAYFALRPGEGLLAAAPAAVRGQRGAAGTLGGAR